MKYSGVSLLIPDVCLAPGKDPSGAAARSSRAVDASALDSAGLLRRPAEGWSCFVYISKHSGVSAFRAFKTRQPKQSCEWILLHDGNEWDHTSFLKRVL